MTNHNYHSTAEHSYQEGRTLSWNRLQTSTWNNWQRCYRYVAEFRTLSKIQILVKQSVDKPINESNEPAFLFVVNTAHDAYVQPFYVYKRLLAFYKQFWLYEWHKSTSYHNTIELIYCKYSHWRLDYPTYLCRLSSTAIWTLWNTLLLHKTDWLKCPYLCPFSVFRTSKFTHQFAKRLQVSGGLPQTLFAPGLHWAPAPHCTNVNIFNLLTAQSSYFSSWQFYHLGHQVVPTTALMKQLLANVVFNQILTQIKSSCL